MGEVDTVEKTAERSMECILRAPKIHRRMNSISIKVSPVGSARIMRTVPQTGICLAPKWKEVKQFFQNGGVDFPFGTVTHCSPLKRLRTGTEIPILVSKGEITWDFWSTANGTMSGMTPRARKVALSARNRNSATG
ncbi:hypothetical protein HED49_11000 [Ochrobactrum daejeonense]|nr:hypothetical protein [Brucella daejeonensis]